MPLASHNPMGPTTLPQQLNGAILLSKLPDVCREHVPPELAPTPGLFTRPLRTSVLQSGPKTPQWVQTWGNPAPQHWPRSQNRAPSLTWSHPASTPPPVLGLEQPTECHRGALIVRPRATHVSSNLTPRTVLLGPSRATHHYLTPGDRECELSYPGKPDPTPHWGGTNWSNPACISLWATRKWELCNPDKPTATPPRAQDLVARTIWSNPGHPTQATGEQRLSNPGQPDPSP